jgi:hypothetical protein
MAFTLACLEANKPGAVRKPSRPMRRRFQSRRGRIDAAKPGSFGQASCAASIRSMWPSNHQAGIGQPWLFKGVPRNQQYSPDAPGRYVVSQKRRHDIDSTRWLMGRNRRVYAQGACRSGASRRHRDLLILTLALSGGLATIEVYVSARYGYEVSAEVVEIAARPSPRPDHVLVRRDQQRGARMADWLARFDGAYILGFKLDRCAAWRAGDRSQRVGWVYVAVGRRRLFEVGGFRPARTDRHPQRPALYIV